MIAGVKMIKADLHTHTVRSDGNSSAEQAVLQAAEKGVSVLGFSDHCYTPWYDWGSLGKDLSAYIEENTSLADRFAGIIEIVCGIENEFDCWQEDSRLQYRIGSRHSIGFPDGRILIDESPVFLEEGLSRWYGGSGMALVRDYYRHIAEDVPKFAPDIIGHFDLVRKFNLSGRYFDENCSAYRKAALEAAEAAGDSGAIFEVSTVNLNRKRRHILFPADFILKFILEKGYPVTLSSDAHDPSHICGHFGYASSHLADLGFRSIMVWKNGSFNDVSLTD